MYVYVCNFTGYTYSYAYVYWEMDSVTADTT